MKVSAAQIALIVGGVVEGNADVEVDQPEGIEKAQRNHITFLGNLKYEPYLYTTAAGIVLVPDALVLKEAVQATLIRVEKVYDAVAVLLEKFGPQVQRPADVASRASVDPGATIGEGVSIGDFVVIEKGAVIGERTQIYPQVFIGEGVVIGSGTIIYPGVRIYHGCRIGNNCILHSNTVIGSDGFGFARQPDGTFRKVSQIGIVQIEDDVEIGACVTIDRATMGVTTIRQGVKLDNLIHIAHNVQIGRHTAMAAQAGVAGSTHIGEGCLVGGQVGFVGHLQIADGTEIQAQSGIASSVTKKGSRLFGYPAIDYVQYLRSFTIFKKLPALWNKLLDLEKRMDRMDGRG